MRKLQTADLFCAARFLEKMGLKDKLRPYAERASADAEKPDIFDMGYDIIWDIVESATGTQNEKYIYDFLSGPFEMPAEDIAKLPPDEFFSSLKILAGENDLKAFFGRLGKLTK